MKKLDQAKAFVKVWNDAVSFTSYHDIARALDCPEEDILKLVKEYNKIKDKNKLPELIWRRADGVGIPVPQRALRQLDAFKVSDKLVRNAKKIVVTAAQFGGSLNNDWLTTLETYCKHQNAVLVVLPIKYGPVKFIDGKYTQLFPNRLKGKILFYDMLVCNGSFNLNTERLRPTLERFLTDSLCELGGNTHQIFAAPAAELQHQMIVDCYPKAIMTSCAVTHPTYTLDKLGQQDRTGAVAMHNHVYGAVVLNCDGDGFTQYYHLFADKNNGCYDLDHRSGGSFYYSGETVIKPHTNAIKAIVLGDWHTGKTDPVVRDVTFNQLIPTINPERVYLHDFVDCDSVSKWEIKQATRRAWKAPLGYDSLDTELKSAVAEINWMKERTDAEIFVVASNHIEYVNEYIDTMRWTKDDANLEIGSTLFSMVVADIKERNPVKVYAATSDPVALYLNSQNIDRFKALDRTENHIVAGHLLNMHGDLGPKGVPTRSNKEFRKVGMPCVLGHNHSATTWGTVKRAGTSTPRTQFYVTSPGTNWTNSHVILFDNNQSLTINIINGKYCVKQ